VRGGRLPPHHLVPRPPRRDGALHHDHPRRQGEVPGAAFQRQRGRERRGGGRTPLGALRRPVPEAVVPVCDGGGEPGGSARSIHFKRREEEIPVRVCRARKARPGGLGDGLPAARDEVGRGALRPVARPRPVQDRGGRRLQLRRDGEQGPQHLQHQVRAGARRHRHRRRLSQHRPSGRARVLPQLDRQPGHLPGLVPALAQGRPDRFPRPGIRRRHLLARGDAHPGSARPARRPVSGGRRPDEAPGAAAVLHGNPQLLHHDGLRERRRGGAHAAHAARRGEIPGRDAPLLPAPRRPGRHLRRLRAGDGGCKRDGRLLAHRPLAVQALVRRCRHSGPRLQRRILCKYLYADREAVDESAVPHPVRREDRRPGKGPLAQAGRGEVHLRREGKAGPFPAITRTPRTSCCT